MLADPEFRAEMLEKLADENWSADFKAFAGGIVAGSLFKIGFMLAARELTWPGVFVVSVLELNSAVALNLGRTWLRSRATGEELDEGWFEKAAMQGLKGGLAFLIAGSIGMATTARLAPADTLARAPQHLSQRVTSFLKDHLTWHSSESETIPAPASRGSGSVYITSLFDDPRPDHLHQGIDIGAREGTPIRAPDDGMVDYTGWGDRYGRYVRIEMGDHDTLYAHMSRFADLSRGSAVHRGDTIGYVGESGDATGPHLHFEYILGHKPDSPKVDPLNYMSGQNILQIVSPR